MPQHPGKPTFLGRYIETLLYKSTFPIPGKCMMFFRDNKALDECKLALGAHVALINAIESNVATISFKPDGSVISANPLFLSVMGYDLRDIQGQHHRMFCPPDYVNTPQYADFWQSLRNKSNHKGTFLRKKKNGEQVWLEATYFPVSNEQGQLTHIYKIAANVTQDHEQHQNLTYISQALDRSMATIEFTPEGEIITANKNFLDLMGYRLDDIAGRHHRLFCDDDFYKQNPDFWQQLSRGKFSSGQFQRRTARGRSVWLEASYNPILDAKGMVVKVIKFASDITARIERNEAVTSAAKMSSTTAENTAAIAGTGADLLAQSVQVSNSIVDQVGQANEFLQKLNEQSRNIGAIVSTIRGIADQTNLLALNAAIEAARAGEQGRGFAVVADEVRQLAGRTSQSTIEIEQVVSANEALTGTVTERMSIVKNSAELSNRQITQVSSVIAEIQEGALNVSKTVSALL